MSIVIDDDDDDDIICTTDESTIQCVYPDDKRLNEFLQGELDSKYSNLVAESYKRIFEHYSESVSNQLKEKIDLEDRISSIGIERRELKRQIDEINKVFDEESGKIYERDQKIDEMAEKAFVEKVEMVPDESDTATPSEDEVSKATCGNRFELGSRLVVHVDQELWLANGINYNGVTLNGEMINLWEKQHWHQFQHRKPIPQYFHGILEEIEIAPEDAKTSFEFLNRCQYHISLEMDFGEDHPVGVKVPHFEIGYFGNEVKASKQIWPFELGQKVVAPLEPIKLTEENRSPNITEKVLYPGYIIEIPKPNTIKHGNSNRVLIFFECGVWRYVPPEVVAIVPGFARRPWDACAQFPKEVFDNSPRRNFPQWMKRLAQKNFQEFSDQKFIEILLKPKATGKIAISYMVATNETVKQIEVRPPQFQFGRFEFTINPTWIFHQAQIIDHDCNMVLCQWLKGETPFAEWIFKGSPQIKKLFNKFLPGVDQETPLFSPGKAKINRSKLMMPRQMVGNKKRTIISSIDLTGDDDKAENLDFIYLSEPESRVMAVNTQAKHFCTTLCINWTEDKRPDGILTELPLLQRPLIFGFKRYKIINERLIRDAEADCDKINCFYRTPCKKDIYDRAALDKFFQATGAGQYLEHDCFSFDQSVILNRIVDKTKLKGLVDEDISNGQEAKKIAMYNQVDDQKPPPLDYHISPVFDENVRINSDPDFLSCCECTDGCRGECPCKQLTIDGAKEINALYTSYQFGRLVDIIATGIHECGAKCLCKLSEEKPCQNSLVQRGIRQELQLFKTFKKGWGIRTMCDIPFGAFICIYTGTIRREDEAEQAGRTIGDEYFANLNYIESAENTKIEVKKNDHDSGQEDDLDFNGTEDENSEEEPDYKSPNYSTSHYRPTSRTTSPKIARRLRKRKKKEPKKPEKTEEEKKPEDEKTAEDSDSDEEWSRTREYFQTEKELEPEEDKSKRIMFVVDAKHKGNLGRYLNHSCNPNLDTQNGIINTADLRFPTVAFFAKRNIKAGEELCWDYQYELSDDPTRAIICHCGMSNCRGRLR